MAKNKFREFGAEFKNEADAEEEVEEDSLDIDEIEKEHFDED